MNNTELKPLKWNPEPGLGYSVERRPDGGMNVVFHNAKAETLFHWRNFALEHLLDSDRLVRNLYDLRDIDELPEEAIQYALEVNNDPSVRNIRLAVIATSKKVRSTVRTIRALSSPGGVEMALFTNLKDAEEWLSRPLEML